MNVFLQPRMAAVKIGQLTKEAKHTVVNIMGMTIQVDTCHLNSRALVLSLTGGLGTVLGGLL